jgi:hypothetical protein
VISWPERLYGKALGHLPGYPRTKISGSLGTSPDGASLCRHTKANERERISIMRKQLLSATLMSSLIFGGAALAEETLGTIVSIDPAGNAVTLNDGNEYVFADSASDNDGGPLLAGYSVGDMVMVNWTMQGDRRVARSIGGSAAVSEMGVIADIDTAGRTVTLADGRMFSFPDRDGAEAPDISGFTVGDSVEITAAMEGDGMVGLSIASAVSTQVTGTVAAMDEGEFSVTLDDGNTYVFPTEMNDRLRNFAVGDMVTITAVETGTDMMMQGLSIAPAS